MTSTKVVVQSLSPVRLCDPMNCSLPGFLVLHNLLELAQTHVHWVIQPSLLPLSLFAFNLSQHQGLFQWVGSSHQVVKVLELQLQHQSFLLIILRLLTWPLHDPDNHNGVITHLEPDILECEVKWALESITDEQSPWRWWHSSWAISNPERQCCESAALNMPTNLENSAVATGLEKVRFHSNPKERQCQRMLKLPHNCTHLTC